jgi:hypothetical protein
VTARATATVVVQTLAPNAWHNAETISDAPPRATAAMHGDAINRGDNPAPTTACGTQINFEIQGSLG